MIAIRSCGWFECHFFFRSRRQKGSRIACCAPPSLPPSLHVLVDCPVQAGWTVSGFVPAAVWCAMIRSIYHSVRQYKYRLDSDVNTKRVAKSIIFTAWVVRNWELQLATVVSQTPFLDKRKMTALHSYRRVTPSFF